MNLDAARGAGLRIQTKVLEVLHEVLENRVLGAAVVALVAVTLGQMIFLQRTITRPIAALTEAAVRVREGAPIGRSLGVSRLFPPMMIHLIASGETSGELDTMLERAAQHQERELDMLGLGKSDRGDDLETTLARWGMRRLGELARLSPDAVGTIREMTNPAAVSSPRFAAFPPAMGISFTPSSAILMILFIGSPER